MADFNVPQGPSPLHFAKTELVNPPVLGYVPTKAMVQELVEYQSVQVLDESDIDGETGSFFGLPVFGVVEFEAFTPEPGEPRVSDLRLESCIINVGVSKNSNNTPITNRNGTVKHSIGLGDYVVDIEGGLFSPIGVLRKPWQAIQHVNAYVRHRQMVKVNNKLLNTLGIFDLFIEDMQLVHTDYVNVQRFRLSCLSDQEFELKINP